MKIIIQQILSVSLIYALSVFHVLAADSVQVEITGKVIVAPCNVDASSVSQEVDFGRQLSTDLKTAGSTLDWQPFTVNLVNCPDSIAAATVTFNGIPSPDDATLYDNTGTAVNVAVQMAQENDKTQILGNGSTMSVPVDAQHNATYSLAGRLISPNGNAGAGTISSIVQMNFTYQ